MNLGVLHLKLTLSQFLHLPKERKAAASLKSPLHHRPWLPRTPSSCLLKVPHCCSSPSILAFHSQRLFQRLPRTLAITSICVIPTLLIPKTDIFNKAWYATLNTDTGCNNLPSLAHSTKMNVKNLEGSENQLNPLVNIVQADIQDLARYPRPFHAVSAGHSIKGHLIPHTSLFLGIFIQHFLHFLFGLQAPYCKYLSS